MPQRSRAVVAAEIGCLAVFLVWLAALPLPFGAIVEGARVGLVAIPLLLCAIVAGLRATRARDGLAPTRAYVWWTGGALGLIAIAALQLVPLSPSLLGVVSPESHAIWTDARRVAALGGVASPSARPISVDPDATLFELFRLIALLATFQTAALLVRNHRRRTALALVLAAAALFQTLYGAREAALGRYAIWGWQNTLIQHRVTGTFVNPNHFAHYIAILFPLTIFLGAMAWRAAGTREMALRQRIINLLERRFLLVAFAAIGGIACVAAILVAQSRGGLLSLAAGSLIVGSFVTGRRPLRLALIAGAGAILVAALVLLIGTERTIARFKPLPEEQLTLVGRRTGIEAAVGVWRRFPILGSGAGTFPSVVLLEQKADVAKHYHRAHDDYAELAATEGGIGFAIGVVALFGGWIALWRMTFGANARELRWRRRAFQAAALASLTIAMVHALIDFNFFIPSNPATLAAIAGAAVSIYNADDKRTRR